MLATPCSDGSPTIHILTYLYPSPSQQITNHPLGRRRGKQMVRQGRERKMHASHALPFSFTHGQRDVLTPRHGVEPSFGIGFGGETCEVLTHCSSYAGGKLKIIKSHKTSQTCSLHPCVLQGRTSPLKFLLVPLRFSMPFKSPTLKTSEVERTDPRLKAACVCPTSFHPTLNLGSQAGLD